MANNKSQKVIHVVLPKGQQTLFSEPDLKQVKDAVDAIGMAYTQAENLQSGFFAKGKTEAAGMVSELEKVAKQAGVTAQAVAKASKTPRVASGASVGTNITNPASPAANKRLERAQRVADERQLRAIEASASEKAKAQEKSKRATERMARYEAQAEIASVAVPQKAQPASGSQKKASRSSGIKLSKQAQTHFDAIAAQLHEDQLDEKQKASAIASLRSRLKGVPDETLGSLLDDFKKRKAKSDLESKIAASVPQASKKTPAYVPANFGGPEWFNQGPASGRVFSQGNQSAYTQAGFSHPMAAAMAGGGNAYAGQANANAPVNPMAAAMNQGGFVPPPQTATARQGGYGPFLTPAQQAQINAQNAAANPGNPPPQRRQAEFNQAVNQISTGRGLYGVSRELTTTELEGAYNSANERVREELAQAGRRQIAARTAGNAREQAIAADEIQVLEARLRMNIAHSARLRQVNDAYYNALNARTQAEERYNANPTVRNQFRLQTATRNLNQASRQQQQLRNPNASQQGFGGQNLTFAAQQAAYGVEDFFQVLAAGQSPVRAFLGAANNIGPALALVGVSGAAASVGIAGLLAVTALYDINSRKAKKSTDEWKDSIDRLADSMGKIEKVRGRSQSGSISEDILKISGDPMAVSSEINKLKAQMNRMEKESIPDTRDVNRNPLTAVWNFAAEGIGNEFAAIPSLFGDLFARGGFENERFESKGRFNGPKNFSQAAKEDPSLWNMSLEERVGARQFVNEMQAKFDKEKEAGVYKELESLLKELDDRIKTRAELVRQSVESPNTITDELSRARSIQARTGRPVFGETINRISERIEGNESAISEARQQADMRGPELKKRYEDAKKSYDKLMSADEKEARIKEAMLTYNISRKAGEFVAQRKIEEESQKLAAEVEIRRKAYEDLNAKPEALQIVADAEREKFKKALGMAGAGLRKFSSVLPGVVNEGLFRLDDIKQSRAALKETFDASSAGDQQTILKQLDNAARPKGTAQIIGIEGLYNTIQTSLLNNDPSLEVEKQIRDEIKGLRDDLAREAKPVGRAMGGMIRGYASGGRADARDTIPARLRPGEVVLTPQQQERLSKNSGKSSAEMFAEAGVPGFSGGGGFGFGFNRQLSNPFGWFNRGSQAQEPQKPSEPPRKATATDPQSQAYGAGPAIPFSAPIVPYSSKKRLTPLQQRNEQLKASRKRQQEAIAARNSERERMYRRAAFMGPVFSLHKQTPNDRSSSLNRQADQSELLSEKAKESMRRTAELIQQRKAEKEVAEGRQMAPKNFLYRELSEKGQAAMAKASERKHPSSVKAESDAKRAEMLARKNASDAQEAATEKKSAEAKTDWRSGGNYPVPRLGNTSADIARSMRTGKPEGEGTTAWKYEGPASSGIAPRIDYGKSSGTTVRDKNRANSWMKQISHSDIPDAVKPKVSQRTAGDLAVAKSDAAFSKIESEAKSSRSFISESFMRERSKRESMTPGEKAVEANEMRWRKFERETRRGEGGSIGDEAVREQEGRLDKNFPDWRKGMESGASSKGMEVSLKDGLDNSKVLTDILRTLNEKLGMISNGVGQTVGAIQNMETGLLA